MQDIRNALTPENLAMLQVIAEAGSFAAAARHLGLVPSALTYRVRQIEDALDVLLFDRSARQARPTEAGAELLREGARLLRDVDAVAHRVRRVATGWEPQLTISVDGVVSPHTMLELVEAFYALAPPTRLKLCDGIMSGTLEALTSGRADLAIGVSAASTNVAGLQQAPLGDLLFIYVVAPHHPLASAPEPITDATLLEHRAVAVADSAQRNGMTMGLLGGQDVLTVDTMQAKVQVQLRGLGGGFLPEPMVRPYVEAGHLVARKVARPERSIRTHYAWGGPGFTAPGQALQWWLNQLQRPATRRALLENHHHF
ncbi:MAG: LysR family transcriptional regulator [Giesbergeria sp.]|jgi:DNA-binding transcriptional LysR family regulator|nr:LysR family transcriptional regulator [Giesbergeria sp.]